MDVKKYTGSKRTRLITDDELARLYAYLDHADSEGLEHPLLTLAIRLQFDFAHRRVVWPDSKTGGMSKPLSTEAALLLRTAPRYQGSKFVVPALFDGAKPMSKHTYRAGWRRILERARLPHCRTHVVRLRAATDIANSGVPVKVGMALTTHKTVTMFMRYVHTEDDPIREAAETVATRRRKVVQGAAPAADLGLLERPSIDPATAAAAAAPRAAKTIVENRSGSIGLGNYRPYRNGKSENRAALPKPALRLLKQRGARPGAGRSGGYRTILAFRSGARAVFVFGFAKSDRANLTAQEGAVYKAAAKLALAFSEDQLDAEVASGRITEVNCDGQNLQERGDGGRSRDGGRLS